MLKREQWEEKEFLESLDRDFILQQVFGMNSSSKMSLLPLNSSKKSNTFK